MRRCLAETGSTRGLGMGTKYACARTKLLSGEAEWATMQTVHFESAAVPEWWCTTTAAADHKVSTKHSRAMALAVDRNELTHPNECSNLH